MELNTVDQMKGVGQPVVRDLPAPGEQTNDPRRTRLVFDEPFIDIVDCANSTDLEPVVRIESAYIGHVGYAQQHLLRVTERQLAAADQELASKLTREVLEQALE